jgi:hypothetical protein
MAPPLKSSPHSFLTRLEELTILATSASWEVSAYPVVSGRSSR